MANPNLLTVSEFNKLITEKVEKSKGAVSYLDAVEDFMIVNELEPESVATLISRNQVLKQKIKEDAVKVHLVHDDEAKLPI